METILVRYSEIALKSTPVRKRFEMALERNMKAMLASDNVGGRVIRSHDRLFVETDDAESAVGSLRKVFGIASMSVAVTCPPDMESIISTVSSISKDVLFFRDTFAIDARRSGKTQPFTSLDLKRKAGEAVLKANSAKDVKVDLDHPSKTIFIEARQRKAYIFTSYIRCHAGFPIGTQGKVFAKVDDDRGLISAWLMMKRGCKVTVGGNYNIDLLRKYDPDLEVSDRFDDSFLGYVVGARLRNVSPSDGSMLGMPVFYPSIGLTDSAVDSMIRQIAAERGVIMKAVSLISGGIDSPVASYLMSRAGADVVLLHMSNGEYGDPKDLEKVIRIAERLESYTRREFPVYVADHGRNQKIIQEGCDSHYQCVLCKRTMHRVAKKLAQSIGAEGIVMGDSLGQVASQTLLNIRAEQYGLDFPVFRPLIGLDKLEVIDIAKRIGTYDISIIRTSGCAAVPKGPVTEAKVDKVLSMHQAIDLDRAVEECFGTIERVHRGRSAAGVR
jgi:thiamine biosynthesis protein ThiI